MWCYGGKTISSLDDIPKDAIGFVYEVTHMPTGLKYIGKKILRNKRKLPPLKGYKRKRIKIVESDWKDYYGSSDKIKELIKEGKQNEFKREILKFCYNKKQMSYFELKYQFEANVLTDETYLNENIAGKYWKKDLIP